MKDLLYLLGNIHPLSPQLQQYLSGKLRNRTIARKEFLLQSGSISRHIYFIKKGLLRCYHIANGQEICSKFMKEGDIIVSASSFFLQKESEEFIQAIEDSQVCYICYDELQYMYKNFPEFNIISRIVTTKSYLLSEQRINLIRMKQAAGRYQSMMEFFPELVLRVPAKYLASYLGISVETLSRIRSRNY
ncbi:MAG TPA: Crp/Fnr family transcriptional regulator [Chitinophagaceae bacterium]|nr:Crp/Fnr family transcriptional regulator [Chitinophagaceae bacterium]